VIPNKKAKNIPKYRFQPTSERAFQHEKIEEQVEEASPKTQFL
jgi:hypothetical protein